MLRNFLFLIILLLGVPPIYGATEKEVQELFNEGRQLCFVTLRRCSFIMLDLDIPLAFTQGSNITVASGVYKRLSKDELRGVVYHEVSHAILSHAQRTSEYKEAYRNKYGREMSPMEVQAYSYRKEDDADALAVAMLFWTHKPMQLDEALIKITDYYGGKQATWSHPSVKYRVDRIRKIDNKLRGL